MILVTGGTGLVGSHLLYKLTNSHQKIRAIYRRIETLEKVKKLFSYYTDNMEAPFEKIEWIKADLNDVAALSEAFDGITYVYHCAALISFNPNAYESLKKTNIEGTANIVNLCISHSVKKLCYVSSVATMGYDPIKITENTIWNAGDIQNVYAITKYTAEREVWRGTQEGVPSVIVNPAVVLGPGFFNCGSGLIFKAIYKGLRFTTEGVTGYVNVNDVVKSMELLMNGDYKNERYILVGESLSFKKLSELISDSLRVQAPKTIAKDWMLSIAWRLDWLAHLLMGRKRRLTKNLCKTLNNKNHYSSEKFLKTENNFKFTSISKTIAEICQAFLQEF